MRGYDIVAVFWEDHFTRLASDIPENPDNICESPTLTVGILLRETEKSLLIAHDIERFSEYDNSTFSVILKNAVIGRKTFGKIKIKNIRWKGA